MIRVMVARWYHPLARLPIPVSGVSTDTADRLGGALGVLAYHLGIRRRVVRQTMRLGLPGWPGPRRRDEARRSYATMGANFLQLFAAASKPERALDGLVPANRDGNAGADRHRAGSG